MNRRLLAFGAVAVVAVAGLWFLFVTLPRIYGPRQTTTAAATTTTSAPGETRKIKARLFYVADDGMRLVTSEQDIVYGEGTLEQSKRLIEAQLAPPASPLVSAVPRGTKLRDLYVAENGEAFVDLSSEVSRAHPGGALTELLTVYTIVDVLTANLPAITSVQILIDGKEADTLAGHVDLRRPLAKDLSWTDQGEETVTRQ